MGIVMDTVVLLPRLPHGFYLELQGLPRAHDADHVRDVHRAFPVRCDPGGLSLVASTRMKGIVMDFDALLRDDHRARHVRGDPGWFVSAWLETHNWLREGLWRRCDLNSTPPALSIITAENIGRTAP